ncbi:hypothetical protein L210DRAFT_3527577 [Boletus edulis BED1]|uniref:Uncharacterized protein n=1 Tax=Boletus edulis BED1 TaxID=1328754 RepID=A0AAD4C3Q0_BOLED|nr:hypothetical protein L210DRAFT_3527577 [Boletus edulis BED1]
MDVDIDTLRDSAQRSLSATDDSRFLPEDSPVQDLSFSRADTSKKRKKSAVVSVSTKKKTQVFYSDDEASNSHTERDFVEDGLSDLASPLSEVSDDFELDTPPKRGALKAKAGATKSKAEKAELGQLKGAKAKGLKEKDKEREILMKDERRLAVPPATTSRASSATAQSQPSDLFCNDDLTSSSAVDSLPDASQPAKDPLNQAIPKKRKLPPIKKTKTAISTTTATSTATTTTQKPAPAPAQELPKPLLPVSEQRKQALTGVRDIDLADSKVYAELFKGAGGNTPKSGLKNTEERRKELDRMRDEARAKRAEEMKSTFDLQSQADKIARFERRLRAENSTVLHPNFLAAKMRDEWELERHHRRATSKEEGEA